MLRPRRWQRRRRLLGSSIAALLAWGHGGGVGVRAQDVAGEAAADEVEDDHESLAKLDLDGDGMISIDEYLKATEDQLATREGEGSSEEVLELMRDMYRRMFEQADIDESGSLSEREADYLAHIATYRAWMLQEQAREDEFKRFMDQLEKELQGDLGEPQPDDDAAEAGAGGEATDAPDSGGERGADDDDDDDDDDGKLDVDDEWGQKYVTANFPNIDADSDGKLDIQEFLAAMHDVGIETGWAPYMEDPELVKWQEEIFKTADVTADGFLSAKELHYAGFLVDDEIARGVFLERSLASEMFSSLDLNRNEKIEKEELQELLFAIGPDDEPPELLELLIGLFDEGDADEDGMLDRRETAHVAKKLLLNSNDEL